LSACGSSACSLLVFGDVLKDDVDGLGDRLRTTLGSSAPAAFLMKLNRRPAELVIAVLAKVVGD